jgi:hypothetical protein
MTTESISQYLPYAVFAIVIGVFVLRYFKHGGLKGALFGATVESTIGEVAGGGTLMSSVVIKVNKLEGGSVGVEFVGKSVGRYQTMPVTLSSTETQMLITLLQMALENPEAT